MDTLTIHDLDEDLRRRLDALAAEHGRSPEDEAREILRSAMRKAEGPVPAGEPRRNLATAIHERFKAVGGVDLEIPPREPMRDPPTFK